MQSDSSEQAPVRDSARWPVFLVQQMGDAPSGRLLDSYALLRILQKHTLPIVASCAAAAILGFVWALLLTPRFVADAKLVAVGRQVPTGALGQLGGLAALAGLELGSGSTTEPLAVLRSRELAGLFIDKLGIEPLLLTEDANFLDELGLARPKDRRDAVRYFMENVRSVSEDKKSGIVTVAMEWIDPEQAAAWANDFAALSNERLRENARLKAQRNVDFLRDELQKASIVALQQSIGRLLESEMQQLMMARGESEFAFRVVDHAVPPKKAASPRRVLMTLGFGVLGALLVCAVVAFRTRRDWILRGEKSRHVNSRVSGV